MSKDKQHMGITLPKHLHDAVRQKANRETMSVSAYIRRLIIKDNNQELITK